MSLYQLCLNAKLFLDLGRQTGSPVVKASLDTIGYFDTKTLLLFIAFHFSPPFWLTFRMPF
jgi:hypothetical protein